MAITRKTYESRLKKWLTALRSGKFTQYRGALYNDYDGKDEHCCLGVACEVFHTNSDKTLKRIGDSYGRTAINHYMPTKVIKWLGFTNEGEQKCVDMNDTQKKSFKQIANIVEKNKSEYFIWAQEKEKKSGKATNKKKNP